MSKTDDIYQNVTDTILELLESQEEKPFQRPWIMIDQDGLPARNATTERPYRGINQLLLSFTMAAKGHVHNKWLTYKQTKELGGNIIKGSKSAPLVFFSPKYLDKNKKYIKPEIIKEMSIQEYRARGITKIPVLRLYRTFNIAQTENLDPSFYEAVPQEPLTDIQVDEETMSIAQGTGADIRYSQSNKAYYVPSQDYVQMPLKSQFRSAADHAGTLFHELVHWTAADKRLNREFGKNFGDKEYALEELTAELGAAMLSSHVGFERNIPNSAEYLRSWIKALKASNRIVLSVAQKAQKASDYILNGAEFVAYNPDGN